MKAGVWWFLIPHIWYLPSARLLSSSPKPSRCTTIQFNSDTDSQNQSQVAQTAPTWEVSHEWGVQGAHTSAWLTPNRGIPTMPSSCLTVHWVQLSSAGWAQKWFSLSGLAWVLGDAEELPFDDDKFDVYTIAFGIRNVTHINQVYMAASLACVTLVLFDLLEQPHRKMRKEGDSSLHQLLNGMTFSGLGASFLEVANFPCHKNEGEKKTNHRADPHRSICCLGWYSHLWAVSHALAFHLFPLTCEVVWPSKFADQRHFQGQHRRHSNTYFGRRYLESWVPLQGEGNI